MGLTKVTATLTNLAKSKPGFEDLFLFFGPEKVESILGVVALENVGIGVDPVTTSLKKMPAISLK